jgi:hypothetical protein
MRIAISFSGKRGYSQGRENVGEKLDLEITYNHLKRHILDKYKNSDIFIHTWDEEEVKYLKKIFNPKAIKSEPQKDFGIELKNLSQDQVNNEYGIGIEFRVVSQTYSFFKSLDLIVNHELQNNIKYDFIVCIRMDTIFLKNINFNKLDKKKVHVQKKISYSHNNVYLNFEKSFQHSTYIVILNTDHIKKFKYKDIFLFNFNEQENLFQKIRPIKTWNFQKPIFINNQVKTNLPLNCVNIIRRKYSKKEFVNEDDKLNEYKNLDDKNLEFNNYVYKAFYKKEHKVNYFLLMKYLPLFIERKIIDLKYFFYVFKNECKIYIKKFI